jgi:hypothetical protein
LWRLFYYWENKILSNQLGLLRLENTCLSIITGKKGFGSQNGEMMLEKSSIRISLRNYVENS